MNIKKIITGILAVVSSIATCLHFQHMVSAQNRLNKDINSIILNNVRDFTKNICEGIPDDLTERIHGSGGSNHEIDISGFSADGFSLSEKDIEYYLPTDSFGINTEIDYTDVIRGLFKSLKEDEKRTLFRLSLEESDDISEKKFFEVLKREDITKDNLEEKLAEIGEDIFTNGNPKRGISGDTMVLVQGSWMTITAIAAIISTKLGSLFSIIAGAIKAFIAALTIPWVGWTLAALVLTGIIVAIVINWSTICSALSYITAWFDGVSGGKFTSSINRIISQAQAKAISQAEEDAYNRTKTQAEMGNWTKDRLKRLIKNSIHAGYYSITLEELLRMDKYVYLGKYINGVGQHILIAKANDGIYYETSSAVSNEILNTLRGNYWVLNLYFLNLCIASGKQFRLCSAPNSYYIQGNPGYFVNVSYGSSPSYYARELKYIHENPFVRYNWYSNIPIVETYKSI